MPRFAFALEPLLRARRQAEQLHQRAVASVDRERLKLEQKLRQQQVVIAEGKRSLTGSLTGVLNTTALRFHAAASIQQMREAQRLVLELAGVHRRRRAVELLRERRLEQWQREQDKAESAALDELAVVAAARRHFAGFGDFS
jgi:flagellar biosynthesis chaperone FliJ